MSSTALSVPDFDPDDAGTKIPVRLPAHTHDTSTSPVAWNECYVCGERGPWGHCACCFEAICPDCLAVAEADWSHTAT